MSALDKQTGGSHYKDRGIQPIEYILSNDLGFCEGNVIKYVTRHRDKNGVEDICKAIHYLEFILEDVYNFSQEDYYEKTSASHSDEVERSEKQPDSEGPTHTEVPEAGDTQQEEATEERSMPRVGDVLECTVDSFCSTALKVRERIIVEQIDDEYDVFYTSGGWTFNVEDWWKGLKLIWSERNERD